MNAPAAIVLTGFGINCDVETAEALRIAGAHAHRVHLNDLASEPSLLDAAQIFVVPGGFSFGDDIASGRILANRLKYKLGGPLTRFAAEGKLVLGICNGFQVLVKMGLLPGRGDSLRQTMTVTHNDSGRFENRWVRLKVDPASRCIWTADLDDFELPVRHGEGKVLCGSSEQREQLASGGQVVLRYAGAQGEPARGVYPINPNGSDDDIAGICDPSGRVFGLMPHPEAYVRKTNHPRWTREALPEEGAGLAIIRNGVAYAQAHAAAAAPVS